MGLLKKRHKAQEHKLKQNLKLEQDVEMERLRKVKRDLKGHSQTMHLRIRCLFLADLHITKSLECVKEYSGTGFQQNIEDRMKRYARLKRISKCIRPVPLISGLNRRFSKLQN